MGRRLVAAVTLIATTTSIALTGWSVPPATAAPTAVAAGSYQAVAPMRVLDTVHGVGVTRGRVAAGHKIVVEVAGRGGVPASVGAVAVSVQALAPGATGRLGVYPTGRPSTLSSVQFAPGADSANLVQTPLGTGGAITIVNWSAGAVDLVTDIDGYYVAGTATDGGAYVPHAPVRLAAAQSSATIAAGRSLTFRTDGDGVPKAVTSVALDVLTLSPTADGRLSVYPSLRPTTNAAVQYTRGRDSSHFVNVASGGTVTVTNRASSGSVRVLVDLYGYYRDGAPQVRGAYLSTMPRRVLNTATVTPGHPRVVPVSNADGESYAGQVVVLQVFGLSATSTGRLRVYPSDHPSAYSIVQFASGRDASASAVVAVSNDGTVTVADDAASGSVRVVLDVHGSFHEPSGWSTPQAFDRPSGLLRALDCASSTRCVAVDDSGHSLVGAGTSWRTDDLPLPQAVDISCPTTTFCAAVDYNGKATESPSDGAWLDPKSITTGGAHLAAVSCASSTYCMAVDRAGFAELYNGSTWSSPMDVGTDGTPLTDVSCPAVRRCVATANAQDAYHFDGTSWTRRDLDGMSQPQQVDCATATRCVAVGYGGEAAEFDGTTWTYSPNVDPGGNGLSAVSCPTVTLCVATDELGQYVTYDGNSWSAPAPINQDGTTVYAVSCASATRCTGLANSDSAVTFDGTTWSSAAVIDPVAGNPVDVSCPTATFCTAIDAYANALTLDDSGWSAPTSIEPVFPYPLSSVSCSSASFCAAVSSQYVSGNGNLLTYDGTNWVADKGIHAFDAVSCSSATFCMAVGPYGSRERWDGTVWTRLPYDDATGGANLADISCLSSTFCVDVDRAGGVGTWDGTSWSARTTVDSTAKPGALHVSCTSTTFCVVVDAQGFAERLTGSGWSAPVSIDPAGDVRDVSCAGTHCAAVDGAGHVVEYDGAQWQTPLLIDTAGSPVAVSCATQTRCVAVDDAGYALYARLDV